MIILYKITSKFPQTSVALYEYVFKMWNFVLYYMITARNNIYIFVKFKEKYVINCVQKLMSLK